MKNKIKIAYGIGVLKVMSILYLIRVWNVITSHVLKDLKSYLRKL